MACWQRARIVIAVASCSDGKAEIGCGRTVPYAKICNAHWDAPKVETVLWMQLNSFAISKDSSGDMSCREHRRRDLLTSTIDWKRRKGIKVVAGFMRQIGQHQLYWQGSL